MKRVFIIDNPVASRSSRSGLDRVRDTLRRGDHDVTVARTAAPHDATRLAAQAAAEGFDVIAVYGGDGTVMQAVAGLQGSGSILGIIPGGTGNLLAGNLGIPRNPARAAAVIAGGRRRQIDLMRLETTVGERFVSVGAGTGYDAEMMAATTTDRKRRWGVAAYVGFVLRTAPFVRSRPVTVTIDGATTRHDAATVLVANCPQILPPVLRLGPEVAIDDGVLDVVVLRADGLAQTILAVWDLLRLRESGRVRRLRGRQVRIETDPPQPVQADGDLCGETPFTATIIENGLTVIAP